MKMDLGVNRALLNPRFDGYKLSTPHPSFSLHSIHVHQPLQPVLESKSYALTAAKFAFNNLVSIGSSLVAFIDSSWHLVLVSLQSESVVGTLGLPQPPLPAAELPPSLLLVRSSDNPYLQEQNHLVIVGDGCGSIFVIDVPVTAPADTRIVARYNHHQPAVVSDALCIPKEQSLGHSTLHLTIYSLAVANDTTSASTAVQFQGTQLAFQLSALDSPTLALTPDKATAMWSSSTHPVLAHLSPDASTLTLAACAPIHALCTPSPPPPPPPSAAAPEPATCTVFRSDKYAWWWHQSHSDVTIHISLTSPASKHAIQSTISATHISLKLVHTALTIFSHAPLWAPVWPDDSLWTLEDNGATLTLHLEKRDHGTRWPQLLLHDTPGAQVLETVDASEQAAHVEQLGKYTASEPIDQEPAPAPAAPVTMNDPLEDIDLLADQSRTHVSLLSLDAGACQLLATHALGAYLCPVMSFGGPGMCVKSDVDGLLYTAAANRASLGHSGTAHAFAYVQASKRDRRISVATRGWAAVVDVSGGVYLYVFGREREGKAPQYVVESGVGNEGDDVVGVVAVDGVGSGLGKLVVLVGRRVVCVDVDKLVDGQFM
ncbi:hypothetical protein BCR44DRAFT_1434140 [Catenaria anguillulae PL171]|uniref:NudC domain-containing protein 1 n=1 Tax=Catenaria anguillulae PL171 TaxID=765915 RepID=A0A1Y2HLE1_9FUNG|nr:hypothetical protein BCR44DRAFT_1434140 [Catenaria anguillulae PL171]